MSSYYAILGLAMAGGGLLVDAACARVAWGVAGCIYLGAAVLAVVLTSRLRDASVPDEEPSGLERIRSLMGEIEETRRRERAAAAERPVRPAREAEGRPSP